MDATGTDLERLATLAGVLPAYDDVFGVAQAADANTLRSILATLGFDSASGASAAADGIEAAPWRRELEPVSLFEVGTAYAVVVTTPADAVDDYRSWRLASEDGATTSGRVRLRDLPLKETRVVRGETYERRAFALDASHPVGYHRLTLRAGDAEVSTVVVIAPRTCWLPERFASRGVWGLAVQLYALRSERNWGIGDFTDLARLCEIVRDAGGAAIGLNPLHAIAFEPGVAPSPYSPSSRLWTTWIYLDVERLPGFSPADADAKALARARAGELVDYDAVVTLKSGCARAAYERFIREQSSERSAFASFVAEGGAALRRAATFEALAEHFARQREYGRDWPTWPASFRDPSSDDVAAFARGHEEEIGLFLYLQWQTDVQLRACAEVAPRPIGLYRDLAVGAGASGADTWSEAATIVREATVGAPPDVLNVRGQNWGVAPFDPLALRATAYAPFIALLRANMRYAGALRIDHAMALARLYWIPTSAEPREGAYVTYPLDDLLAILALESRRSKCMVIGEDLGTVPAGFREKLAAKNVFSYRLLQFERDDDGFFAPATYPAHSLVSIATHDLPPIGSYWTASDIATRSRLGLYPDADRAAADAVARAEVRDQLLAALDGNVGLSAEQRRRFLDASSHSDDRETLAEIALVANRYLAKSPARLLMVQLEDVLGDVDQANVPTTTHEHPNWRRRASVALEELPTNPSFVALAEAMADEGRSE